jgi:16S rRNA A1518/A1519 N6-dimethyltransferase RsmA/KsgA/DIM1 with predicted DNA glycosylase/AP lyase activity
MGFEFCERIIFTRSQTSRQNKVRYIKKYIKPDSYVLEVGAGTGRYSRTIADLGNVVEAVYKHNAVQNQNDHFFVMLEIIYSIKYK